MTHAVMLRTPLVACSLGAQPWAAMGDMAAGQGSGGMPGSLPAPNAPGQASMGAQAWGGGGNGSSAWAPVNSVVWPGWPSQGMEVPQQQHQMQHSYQQQQQMETQGLGLQSGSHPGMQHGSGAMLQHSSMLNGSHTGGGGSGLHGAGSSMFSGNSGATVFDGTAANGHHRNSQSLNTGN